MGWNRRLPALAGWSAVAVLVVAAAATTPGATRAERVRAADPAEPGPLWTVTATFPVTAVNPATRTPAERPSVTPPPVAPTTTTASSSAAPAPSGSTTSASTATSPAAPGAPPRAVDAVVSTGRPPVRSPACSAPSGAVAVFRQPCAGAAVGLWQRVELDVGELDEDSGIALVLRTSTDRDGAPAPVRDLVVGWADEPGRWSLVVRIGAWCVGDRTGAELLAYRFPARGWTGLAGPELAGGAVVPPGSGLLDRVPVTRADQTPDCEDR